MGRRCLAEARVSMVKLLRCKGIAHGHLVTLRVTSPQHSWWRDAVGWATGGIMSRCGLLSSALKARPKIAQGKHLQGASPWVRPHPKRAL
jgi:hypothetical protein